MEHAGPLLALFVSSEFAGSRLHSIFDRYRDLDSGHDALFVANQSGGSFLEVGLVHFLDRFLQIQPTLQQFITYLSLNLKQNSQEIECCVEVAIDFGIFSYFYRFKLLFVECINIKMMTIYHNLKIIKVSIKGLNNPKNS